MQNVAATIQTALANEFPGIVEVVDDSSKHAGHVGARPGGQSHFSVTVISEKFEGLNRVARHRLVYEVLNPLFEQGLHALAITTRTPGEML